MMKPKSTALQYLIYLLSRRDYSEYELRQKLHQKQYDEQEIEQAIEKVQSQNWQSDERFCQHFIRYRSTQGYGPRRIQQELRLKGIKSDIISLGLEECDVDWFDIAERLFEKKRPAVLDLKGKQKMWRYMLSHGFDNDHFSHLMELDDEYEQ